jgi:hypothetical protein
MKMKMVHQSGFSSSFTSPAPVSPTVLTHQSGTQVMSFMAVHLIWGKSVSCSRYKKISVGSYILPHLYPDITDLAGVLQGLCSGVVGNDLFHYKCGFSFLCFIISAILESGEKCTFNPLFKNRSHYKKFCKNKKP